MVGVDNVLYKVVNVLPAIGALVFGYNAYLQALSNTVPPLQASFSLAVFLTFILSVGSIYWAHSLKHHHPDSPVKERRRRAPRRLISALFCLVAIAFLCRSWTALPPENRWIVVAASSVPAASVVAYACVYNAIIGSCS